MRFGACLRHSSRSQSAGRPAPSLAPPFANLFPFGAAKMKSKLNLGGKEKAPNAFIRRSAWGYNRSLARTEISDHKIDPLRASVGTSLPLEF